MQILATDTAKKSNISGHLLQGTLNGRGSKQLEVGTLAGQGVVSTLTESSFLSGLDQHAADCIPWIRIFLCGSELELRSMRMRR